MSLDRLDALKNKRSLLIADIAALRDQKTKLDSVQDREQAASDALSELAAGEIAAVRVWASAGSAGPMPQPDMARRAKLGRELAEAQALVSAASVASADIEAELGAVYESLRSINAQIEAEAIAALEAEFAEANAEHVRLGEELHAKVAANAALARWFSDHGIALNNRASGTGHPFFKAGERLSELPRALIPDVGAVLKNVPAWQSRFEELMQ